MDELNVQILAEIAVAFGQGTGDLRLADDVATQHVRVFQEVIQTVGTRHDLATSWSTDRAMVLDLARAWGRLAALLAIQAGSPTIDIGHFVEAGRTVVAARDTLWCLLLKEFFA